MDRKGSSALASRARSVAGTPSVVPAASRPITQQGLAGVRFAPTANAGASRTYRDKRFYLAQIQGHMNAIREELVTLNKRTQEYKIVTTNYDNVKKATEAAAEDFGVHLEILHTYNTALDLNLSRTKNDEIVANTAKIKKQNGVVLTELDNLFHQKIKREEKIHGLQKQMQDEDERIAKVIDQMSPDERKKYDDAVSENENRIAQIMSMQAEIKRCKGIIKEHEQDFLQNPMLQNRLILLEKLEQLQRHKAELVRQQKENLSPAEQREALLQQLKKDRADADALQKVKASLEEELNQKEERISVLEYELDEKHKAHLKKHKELREREVMMDKFIGNFDEKYSALNEKIDETKDSILVALEHLTGASVDLNFEELDDIQSDLNQSSVEGLSNEYALLGSRLARLNTFKEKYQTEVEALKKKRKEMELDMVKFRDLEKTKEDINEKKRFSEETCSSLRDTLNATNSAVAEALRKQADVEAKLSNHTAYKQIVDVEKRIQAVEKDKKELEEMIKTASSRDEIVNVLEEIVQLTKKRNENIIHALRLKKSQDKFKV